MKLFLILILINTKIYATNLKLDSETSIYKIEYNPKIYKIKILSKKNPSKKCDKEAISTSTKGLIERSLKSRNKKVIINFKCF